MGEMPVRIGKDLIERSVQVAVIFFVGVAPYGNEQSSVGRETERLSGRAFLVGAGGMKDVEVDAGKNQDHSATGQAKCVTGELSLVDRDIVCVPDIAKPGFGNIEGLLFHPAAGRHAVVTVRGVKHGRQAGEELQQSRERTCFRAVRMDHHRPAFTDQRQ